MKKAFSLLSIVLLLVLCFSMTSCSIGAPTFENTPSGFQFQLSEAVMDIEQRFLLDKEVDGFVPGAAIKVSISGFSTLSYFNASVTLIWHYEYLDNDGDYVEGSTSVTVDLDATGSGSLDEVVEFDGHRNIKDVELDLVFKGFAVKK